jgi:GTPase SAR1 family protein
MGKYAQLVMGPAGSGKSTYCTAIEKHCLASDRRVHIVNLDPAAESFNYSVSIDIRDLISLEDVMKELNYGPNGGLIYCMQYLIENLDWLGDELADYSDDYLIFDCPGQIELFTHLPIMQEIIKYLAKLNYNICAVYLLDCMFINDSSRFISGSLMCLAAGSQITGADGLTLPIQALPSHHKLIGYFNGELEEDVQAVNIQDSLVSHKLLARAKLAGKGLSSLATSSATVYKGTKKVIRLTFIDGRQLICTPDHRLLSVQPKDEEQQGGQLLAYEEAGTLTAGLSKVRFSLKGTMNPCYNHLFYQDLQLNLAIGTLHCGAMDGCKRAFALGQILGYVMRDSSINVREGGNYSLEIADQLDIPAIEEWIVDACGAMATGVSSGGSYWLTLPSLLNSTLLALIGGGEKWSLPAAILAQTCPRILKLGFLRGLFGRAGNTVTLSQQGNSKFLTPVGFAHQVNDHKDYSKISNYFSQLQVLLGEFDISCSISCNAANHWRGFMKRMLIEKNIAEASIPEMIGAFCAASAEVSLWVAPHSLPAFLERIGFGGALSKQLTAEISCAAQAAILRLNEIAKTGGEKRVAAAVPSLDSVLHSMNASSLFDPAQSQGNSCSVLPSFNLLLVGVESLASPCAVYDLSVPLTSSFLAEGLVVHNCLSAMIQLELPHINVLTKCDQLDKKKKEELLDKYLDPSVESLLGELNDDIGQHIHIPQCSF